MRIVFLTCLFISSLSSSGQVENGFLDLSDTKIDPQKPIKLDGNWLYVPNQFLDPANAYRPESTYPVPKLQANSIGFGTYLLSVKTGIRKSQLGIEVPDIYSSYHLYVNGVLRATKGKPGSIEEEAKPFRMINVVALPQEAETIELILHTSNYHHHKNGISRSILLGDLKTLEHWQFLSRSFDAFISGSLIIGFFFFLGLYFYGQKDLTALFFSLFCLTYAIRTVTSGNHMVNLLIPDFPWNMQIRIEYASLYLSTIFFGYFVYYLFPKNLPKVAINIYTIIALIFVPLTIILSPYYFTKINIVHLIAMLFGVVLVSASFVKAIIEGKQGSFYSLLSIMGFLIVLVTKTLDYFNIVEEILLVTFIGQVVFFLSHTVILSNHFSLTWREAKENAEASAKAKSDFLSVMSHEIRTPLNSVIGTTYHLLEDNPRKEQKGNLSNLKVSSENLLHIINNILDFNQIDSGKLNLETSTVDFKGLLTDIINASHQFASEKGLDLKLEYDGSLPEAVVIDTTRITQILTNLINNAIKFTETGSVILRVELLSKRGKTHQIKFNVIDTGIGIKKEKLKQIFNPFHQVSTSISRKYGGTGLGLTITKKLIEIMGSALFTESEPGKGSHFSFTLPLKEGKLEKKEYQPAPEVMDLGKARILLVDDHELNLFLTKNFLERWNGKVHLAKNGQQAIDLAKKIDADVILMDIQMPELDGFETSSIIRSKGYYKPIIAITADSYLEKEKFIKYGIDEVVTKPFDPKELYKTIKSSLDHSFKE